MEIECMNTRLLTRSPLAVKIIKVDSPTWFWVQLKNSHEDFNRQLCHRHDHVKEGEVVAVKEVGREALSRDTRDGTALIALRDGSYHRTVHL